MYRLYGKPFTMSMVPEGTLEEIGVPYETVTLPDGRSTDPAYLELRPDGLVPTLVDGDLVIYEGSAIAMHLADRHKGAGLAPPPGEPRKGVVVPVDGLVGLRGSPDGRQRVSRGLVHDGA